VTDQNNLLWNHSPQVRHDPVPGEQLFEMRRGAERLTCRMLYHGSFGFEAQFLLAGCVSELGEGASPDDLVDHFPRAAAHVGHVLECAFLGLLVEAGVSTPGQYVVRETT
jgi:hypothetical protein